MRRIFIALIIAICAPASNAFEIESERVFGGQGNEKLHVLSTIDDDVFAPIIAAFVASHPNITLTYTVASSQEVYRAIATDNAPIDVVISSAMDLQMKLANDGHAQRMTGLATARVPNWARWRDLLVGFAQEPVVSLFHLPSLDGLNIPKTRTELVDLMQQNPDVFFQRIGTYDPALSGTGYLFDTQDARTSDTFWRFAQVTGSLRPNLFATTGDMINGVATGRLAFAYNLVGSYARAQLVNNADVQLVEFQDFTHVLLRTALIPNGVKNPIIANEFIDYLTAPSTQVLMEDQAGLPRISETELIAKPYLRPIRLDPGLLVFVDPIKRTRFLTEWSAAMDQP